MGKPFSLDIVVFMHELTKSSSSFRGEREKEFRKQPEVETKFSSLQKPLKPSNEKAKGNDDKNESDVVMKTGNRSSSYLEGVKVLENMSH